MKLKEHPDIPKLKEQFLSKDKLPYQLGICEGRKQMHAELAEKEIELDVEKVYKMMDKWVDDFNLEVNIGQGRILIARLSNNLKDILKIKGE